MPGSALPFRAGRLVTIERHRVTHAPFVPTHFVRLLKLPEAQRRAFDLSSLRVVVHAAAPCPVEVKRRMIDWLGPKVFEYYAGSESNGLTMIDSADWLNHPGSVARWWHLRIPQRPGEDRVRISTTGVGPPSATLATSMPRSISTWPTGAPT